MSLIRLLIITPLATLLIGCATGSDIDTGGYFSTGMTLSSAEYPQMNNQVDFKNRINQDNTVNGAILMGSKPANMREKYIGFRSID